jgi:hypothetical protein
MSIKIVLCPFNYYKTCSHTFVYVTDMLVLMFASICTILFQVFLFTSAEASSNSL